MARGLGNGAFSRWLIGVAAENSLAPDSSNSLSSSNSDSNSSDSGNSNSLYINIDLNMFIWVMAVAGGIFIFVLIISFISCCRDYQLLDTDTDEEDQHSLASSSKTPRATRKGFGRADTSKPANRGRQEWNGEKGDLDNYSNSTSNSRRSLVGPGGRKRVPPPSQRGRAAVDEEDYSSSSTSSTDSSSSSPSATTILPIFESYTNCAPATSYAPMALEPVRTEMPPSFFGGIEALPSSSDSDADRSWIDARNY